MPQSKFLFVTALTPAAKRSAVREALFQNYIRALKQQTYPHWQVLLIGEEDKQDGNFIYVRTSSVTKEDKLIDAYNYVQKMAEKPDYLIRLDDDDVISPVVLESVLGKKFDCYSDRYHHFFDLASGMTSRQLRPWIPNTAIHKMEDALTIYQETGRPVFANDHSKVWHVYYKKKKIKYASRFHPVYMRILSPTSITATAERNKYEAYLKTFGKWKKRMPKDFRGLQLEKLTGLIKQG